MRRRREIIVRLLEEPRGWTGRYRFGRRDKWRTPEEHVSGTSEISPAVSGLPWTSYSSYSFDMPRAFPTAKEAIKAVARLISKRLRDESGYLKPEAEMDPDYAKALEELDEM